jgi:hypothetical protein
VLDEFKAAIDPVARRKCRGERDPRLESPHLAGLQVKRQNIRRVDEEIWPVIFPFGIAREFGEIVGKLGFRRAPGEVRVRLAKAQLRERLHDLRPCERLAQENHAGIARLNLGDQPLPEGECFGVRVIDPENAHALVIPKQHDIA